MAGSGSEVSRAQNHGRLGRIILCPVHSRMFTSTSDSYPPDASGPSPAHSQVLQTVPNIPGGARSPLPHENHPHCRATYSSAWWTASTKWGSPDQEGKDRQATPPHRKLASRGAERRLWGRHAGPPDPSSVGRQLGEQAWPGGVGGLVSQWGWILPRGARETVARWPRRVEAGSQAARSPGSPVPRPSASPPRPRSCVSQRSTAGGEGARLAASR